MIGTHAAPLYMPIVCRTTEGQTHHVCQFIKQVLAEHGHNVTICDAAFEPSGPGSGDVCFVAGSLHVGNYQPAVVEYVRRHHEALNGVQSTLLSVSLCATGENPEDWEGLEQCVARFLGATEWKPTAIHHIAGAIRYSHYDLFKRTALKFIAKHRGQVTTTSRDYDMTDYDELKRFVLAFVGERGEPHK